jgi:3-deoxy-D-manno-octulosonic-acid transferase
VCTLPLGSPYIGPTSAHWCPSVDRIDSHCNIAAMPTTSWGYRAAIRLGVAIAPTLGLINPRIRAAIRARRDAGERLLDWARSARDDTRPLAWFHASSVGEGLQAESVLVQLRHLLPECQVVYTHFSPSAESLAARLPVDAADYLPYDLPDPVDRLLGALEPQLVVFSKLDLWPELSTRASTTGAEVAIVAATVSPGSGRLRWPARTLLAPGYQAVAAAGAISPEDATRLSGLGVAAERIKVLGDPRFDSVADRVQRVSSGEPLLRFGKGAPTIVAGSTWPRDEAVLLRAFTALYRRRPDARLIVAPHEPTETHLNAIERAAASAGLPTPVRLSLADRPAPLLLVDRVGVLAALYGAGTMAYVGGGFGRSGLHSVLEPAAWGIPVTFGPRWRNSRDAGLLLEAGGATALPHPGSGRAAAALQRQWDGWLLDDAGRQREGHRAREVVDQGVGASRRSAEMLAELISSRRLRKSPRGARSIPPSMR